MSTPIFISRNFTELGPFTTAEVLDFAKREILRSSDFVRLDGSGSWLTLGEWSASLVEVPPSAAEVVVEPAPSPAVAAPTPTPAKPKAVKKVAAKAAKVAKKAPTKKSAS